MHVYEHLSKMHKDHPVHKEGDAMEKKTLSAAKAKETKTKNAKSKAKAEKEAVKAKTDDPKKKGQVKPDNKDKKDKPLKEEEKYSSPEKKDVKGKVDPKKKDDKHVEVKVVVNKSEHELELLSQLGISKEDLIEKAKSKYGKGKKTVQIAVKGKNKVYYKNQVVGTKDEPVKHSVNKNSTTGGKSAFGALINNLVTLKVQETGVGKGQIEKELAYAMGYGIQPDGTKKIDKYGNFTDVKSNIRKIVQGKSNPDATKKALAGAYFGHDEVTMQELEGKALAGDPTKVGEVDLDVVKLEATGFNYDDVTTIINSKVSKEAKTLAMLELGIRNAGKIANTIGEDDPFKTMEIMVEHGYRHTEEDGFDTFALEKGYVASVENKPPEDRFAGYRVAISDLVNKDITLAAAFGPGGVGKTFNAKKVMKAHGMRPFKHDGKMIPNSSDYDYVIIKGRGSMSHVLGKMFEHSGKLIIFDDFDSVLKPTHGSNDMANILKAGLDGGEEERWVEHGMKDLKTSSGDPVSDPFHYPGRMLIITNLKEEDMPQPIIDRSIGNTFNLSMTKIERLSLMSRIYHDDPILADGKEVDVPFEIRRAAFEFMSKYAHSRRVSMTNGGSKITPRTFKGLALKMMGFAQDSEKQLRQTFDPDDTGKSIEHIHKIIQDTYLRMLL
jgi:hypothetical protein